MKTSGVMQTTLSLALVAACFAADTTSSAVDASDASVGLAASRNRITVRKYRTNYRVDSWDDDREDPYHVTFWKFGLFSVYTFDTSGNIKTLTAGDSEYTFDTEVGSSRRRLVGADDDATGEVDPELSGEISCTDCAVTWTILCDGDNGIADVCYLHDNPQADFSEDAIDSLRRMCSGFSAACQRSPDEACDGQCTDRE